MTLVAGFLCSDGFVMAADTEETATLRSQTTKLDGINTDYQIVIGICGDAVFARQLSQEVKDAIAGLSNHSVNQAEDTIKETVQQFYEGVIKPHWETNRVNPPNVNLLIGMRDQSDSFRLWQTQENAVARVQSAAFIGSGEPTGTYIAERLFRSGLPASVVHHLAIEVMAEARTRGAYVGGDTEVWSVRARDGRPFSRAQPVRTRYLWGLEDALASAVRCALLGDAPSASKRARYISEWLSNLSSPSYDETGGALSYRMTLHNRRDLDPRRDQATGTIYDFGDD